MSQFVYSKFVEFDLRSPSKYPPNKPKKCPFCHFELKNFDQSLMLGHDVEQYWTFCPNCGWWDLVFEEWSYPDFLEERVYLQARLLDLSSEKHNELAAKLLADELYSKEANLLSLSSKQITDIAYRVFSNLFDCSTEISHTSLDNKTNLIGFDSNNGNILLAIDKNNKRIDVKLIRELLGAMVLDNIDRGYLFATKGFKKEVLSIEREVRTNTKIGLELKDFNKLSSWLSLYYYQNNCNLQVIRSSLESRFGMYFDYPGDYIFKGNISRIIQTENATLSEISNVEEILKNWVESFDISHSKNFYVKLYEIINERFNLAEIQVICFKLNIDYEEIPGHQKSNKIIELIKYLERRNQVESLVKVIKDSRPDINFEDLE
jgi:hypothetical protein